MLACIRTDNTFANVPSTCGQPILHIDCPRLVFSSHLSHHLFLTRPSNLHLPPHFQRVWANFRTNTLAQCSPSSPSPIQHRFYFAPLLSILPTSSMFSFAASTQRHQLATLTRRFLSTTAAETPVAEVVEAATPKTFHNTIRLRSHLGGPQYTLHKDPKILPQLAQEQPGARFDGEIVAWLKSFGFIRNTQHNETIFFHLKNCDLKGFIKFHPGQKVTFEVTANERGPVADKVRPLVQKFNTPTIVNIRTKQIVSDVSAV